MEIKKNPPGSKHEAVLETDWFYIDDYKEDFEKIDRLNKTIEEMFPGLLEKYFQIDYDEWVSEMRAKPQLLVNYNRLQEIRRGWASEQMLKGQAFGL
jgi:hypothetical protein